MPSTTYARLPTLSGQVPEASTLAGRVLTQTPRERERHFLPRHSSSAAEEAAEKRFRAVILRPFAVISNGWSPIDSIGVLKSDLIPLCVRRIFFISLSVNCAKNLGICRSRQIRRSFIVPRGGTPQDDSDAAGFRCQASGARIFPDPWGEIRTTTKGPKASGHSLCMYPSGEPRRDAAGWH